MTVCVAQHADERGSSSDAELREGVGEVHLDRLGADVELVCDLLVGEPVGNELGDLVLAPGERGRVAWCSGAGGPSDAVAQGSKAAGRVITVAGGVVCSEDVVGE